MARVRALGPRRLRELSCEHETSGRVGAARSAGCLRRLVLCGAERDDLSGSTAGSPTRRTCHPIRIRPSLYRVNSFASRMHLVAMSSQVRRRIAMVSSRSSLELAAMPCVMPFRPSPVRPSKSRQIGWYAWICTKASVRIGCRKVTRAALTSGGCHTAARGHCHWCRVPIAGRNDTVA